MGVFDRALKFLLNLRLNEPVRRLNWTMTVHPRLDTSPRQLSRVGPGSRDRDSAECRPTWCICASELQGLWRLPRSNGIVFSVRSYLLSLRDCASIPKWARRVHRVLRDLHPALVDYKGLTRYRDDGGRVSGAIR